MDHFAGTIHRPAAARNGIGAPDIDDRSWAASQPRLKPVLRWAFYLFVFSIPFESLLKSLTGGTDSSFSLSKGVGYLFLLTALFNPKACFRHPPRALQCFALYLCVWLALGCVQNVEYHADLLGRLSQLVQMFLMFWVTYNLMRYERTATGMLRSLAASCVCLSVLQLSGVISSQYAYGSGVRVSVLAENLNTAGAVFALGSLALVGPTCAGIASTALGRLVPWMLFPLLAASLIATGSRGGLLSFTAGALALVLSGGTVWGKFRRGVVVLLALAFFVGATYQSDVARERWQKTINEGSFSGREEIAPTAWQMFTERPLLGWGPANHLVELGRRLGVEKKDTHNLYLWILTETGLVGGLPFFLGLWMCCAAAWRARSGTFGSLPLALVLCVLVFNLSGTWFNHKLCWLMLAFALASDNQLPKPVAARSSVLSHFGWHYE